jgi:hypothetical protein
MRHNKVCAHLHYSISKALGIETTDKWYTHKPKPVYEQEVITVLWNQAVHTHREVTAKRPNIIKHNRENMHTDVAIPRDRNVLQKEGEKKLKYKILCIETQQTCNPKCKIIPGTGILTKVLRKNLEATPRKHSVDSPQ